ncbi:MAG: helix-turn-helix domain-containing protein [Thermodesulfobacteriota bacterium]
MTPIPNNKKVFTVSEFSKELGVPQSSVRRWLKSGELLGTKMGKKWLIPASEIERLVNPPKGRRTQSSGVK